MATIITIISVVSVIGLLAWMYTTILLLLGHIRFQDEQMKNLNLRLYQLEEERSRNYSTMKGTTR